MKKCHLCQQDFNDGDVISLEGLDVCAGCKSDLSGFVPDIVA